MSESVLKTKSYAFAVRVVKLSRFLATEKHEFVLSKQILRSGTSIGANIEEANQSSKDFVHKLSIALKEATESNYWLRLLRDSCMLEPKFATSLLNDCEELQKMLTTAIKTSKRKQLDRS